LGSEDEHFSLSGAASARPMMAAGAASQVEPLPTMT
jgi:hypothetical protein